MKRIISLLVSLLVVMSCVSFCASAQLPDITVLLNGRAVDCESYGQTPVIVEGRTLVPLRAIFEALGASVEWDNSTRTVTSALDDVTIKLTIGENTLYKNGQAVTIDVPAMIMNSRTLVPARAVAESFGVKVDWDNATRTVILKKETNAVDVEISDAMEQNASVTVKKCFDSLVKFNFVAASECLTQPELFTSRVTAQNLEELLSASNLDEKSFEKMFVSSNEDEASYAYAAAVAGPLYDFTVGLLSKTDYRIASVNKVDENNVEFVVEVYMPDAEAVNQVKIDEVLTDALVAAFEKGMINPEMTQQELASVICSVMEKALSDKLNVINKSVVMTLEDTVAFTVTNAFGEWKLDCNDAQAQDILNIFCPMD